MSLVFLAVSENEVDGRKISSRSPLSDFGEAWEQLTRHAEGPHLTSGHSTGYNY